MDKVGVVKEIRNIVSKYLLIHGIMHSGHQFSLDTGCDSN